MKKKNINITINFDDVFDRVFAESARRALAASGVYVLTEDNAPLLVKYIEDGLADVRTRMDGYVTLCSFNPNVDERNIVLQLALKHAATPSLDNVMADTLTQLLANYVLLRFYGESDTCYGIAWRKYRAQLLLVLARDQAAIAQ
ncbi:MAG: hypothetical protein J6S96_02635 [Muribaculaceae bacterium]|nr:hypothetical protein [Muribaculaceae bacterium]